MSGQHCLVGVTRIRTPLIGMREEPLSRPPPRQRHLERRDDEMPVVDRTDGPADQEPGAQV